MCFFCFLHTVMSSQGGEKLCTDDTPQCLCQRACYPKLTTSLTPCSCEGDDKKSIAPGTADPAAVGVLTNQNTPATENVGAIPAVSFLSIVKLSSPFLTIHIVTMIHCIFVLPTRHILSPTGTRF